jgi:hypothetical protein
MTILAITVLAILVILALWVAFVIVAACSYNRGYDDGLNDRAVIQERSRS